MHTEGLQNCSSVSLNSYQNVRNKRMT